jgi:hypothetical protein
MINEIYVLCHAINFVCADNLFLKRVFQPKDRKEQEDK